MDEKLLKELAVYLSEHGMPAAAGAEARAAEEGQTAEEVQTAEERQRGKNKPGKIPDHPAGPDLS